MLAKLRKIERARKLAAAQAAADRVRRDSKPPADSWMPKRDTDRGGVTQTFKFTFGG